MHSKFQYHNKSFYLIKILVNSWINIYVLVMKKSWFLSLFFLFTLCITSVYSQSPILSDYIEFDGSSGYIQIPGDSSNNFGTNDAFTFEAWIKISSGVYTFRTN